MKNLKEEIQRSKKLMGIFEGLNLIKKDLSTPEKWFKNILIKLESTGKKYPQSVFYMLDDDLYMKYRPIEQTLYFSYDNIYKPLQKNWGLKNDQIVDIIKNNIKDVYNLELSENPIISHRF